MIASAHSLSGGRKSLAVVGWSAGARVAPASAVGPPLAAEQVMAEGHDGRLGKGSPRRRRNSLSEVRARKSYFIGKEVHSVCEQLDGAPYPEGLAEMSCDLHVFSGGAGSAVLRGRPSPRRDPEGLKRTADSRQLTAWGS